MTADASPNLPSSAVDASADPRDLAIWSGEAGREALAATMSRLEELADVAKRYLPHALALTILLGGGLAAASLSTAPTLSDSLEEVASIDARNMGLALHLDATGQQKQAAAIGRDVTQMRSEITRLQRALDQSKANQTALTKSAAGQAASSQDEVRGLRTQIAALQKTLDASRDESATKIDALQAKVDQAKTDETRVAELRDRLDKIEKTQTARRDDGPATTGSIGADKPTAAGPTVVKDWLVRDVYSGVALLEGRRGMIEVERGARAPGIGKIVSIEKRDGAWVVVTEKGVILSR